VVKFRYNAAVAVAGGIATISAVPLAAQRWYLVPLVLVPLAVAAWGWRSGTDVDRDGVRVRALLGSRFLPWTGVRELVVGERGRVYAVTAGGGHLRLPAVTAPDLPALMKAGAPANPPGQ
jgi:hypothetical protein